MQLSCSGCGSTVLAHSHLRLRGARYEWGEHLGVKGELARSLRQDKLAPIAAVWNEYLERCHRLLELKGIIDGIFPRLLFYR